MWTEFFNQFARNSAVNQWGKQRQQHKSAIGATAVTMLNSEISPISIATSIF